MIRIVWAILFLVMVVWHAHGQTVFPQSNSPASPLLGTEQIPCVQPVSGPTRICTPVQITALAFGQINGDCTISPLGAILCPKVGGVSFGPLATAPSPLPIAQGGTGTATPALVAGAGIAITGAWPNNTITATGTPVTSVGETFTGGLISVAGSPVTTVGTFALTVAGNTGGVPYFSSGTTWASSATLGAGLIVVGGGAGAAPATITVGGDCTFASPNITCTKTAGVAFGTFATQNFATPPVIGGTTPNQLFASAFTGSGTATFQGSVDVNNQGADGAALFSTIGYGFPPLKSGFFTGGSNSQSLRYISTYFAQSALYATTTLGNTQGETGLYIAWNNSTGYQNPATATTGQKTAIQVSGSCGPGGGVCWDEAESLQFLAGWQGASGNFGAVHEIDPTNSSGPTVPTGGSVTSIFGLWVAGAIGANPISSMIQISPAAINGAVFASHYAVNIGGATVADLADVNTSSSAINGYVDTGNHGGNAAVYQGVYGTTAVDITGTAPSGLAIVGTNIANSDITTNTHATNGYVDNGVHANGAVYQGTYSTAAITATGAIATTGIFSQNGHAGVTCAGTPTASFASFGGIVTHC